MSRVDKQFRLKELETIIPQLKGERKRAQAEAALFTSKVAKLENEQRDILISLTTEKKEITVSDHALVRYLERKYGFDFEQYRKEILTPIAKQAIQAGVTSIKVGGVSFKVSNNTIVTTI
jgi:ABC-type Zn uptake system ZnuABC Zn-binding protein ZnuA